MGTNYYLWLRAKSGPEGDTEAEPFMDAEYFVQHLSNGYVWANTYYPDLKALNGSYCRVLHIGKSSSGWVFPLCTYPSLGIKSLSDWKALFSLGSSVIRDEYGRRVQPGEMVRTIACRTNPDAGRSEADMVRSMNASMGSLGFRTYMSYDDFLRDNHAKRGPRGLLAGEGSELAKDGTYELTDRWDFC